MIARRSTVPALLITVALLSCKGTEPFVPRPTTLSLSRSTLALSAIDQTEPISATVLDQHGDPLPDAVITWTTSDAAVAVVVLSPSGSSEVTVIARGNGSAQIEARASEASAQLSVNVTQVVGRISRIAGNGQVDTVGRLLPVPLVASFEDAFGHRMPNVAVSFQITSGGGSLSAATATTGVDGEAQVQWTLGTTAGTQTVRFTAVSSGQSVNFIATARAGAPAALTLVDGDNQRAGLGKPVLIAPTVRLRDVFNNPIANVIITFEPTSGGGSVTQSSVGTSVSGIASTGWTMGPTAGENTLLASAPGGAPLTFTFTATALVPGPPASIVVNAGDNQTGLAGFALNVDPTVRVLDADGIALEDVEVEFVASAGGSVSGSPARTDIFGIATAVGWTVVEGGNTLTASVPGTGIPAATINATGGTQQYGIQLRYLTTATPAQQAAFESARTRWQQLIFGDEPDVTINFTTTCGGLGLPMNETVDDVVMFVRLDSIDGPGKILGTAGPCVVRTAGLLPLVGVLRFDTADVATLLAQGKFEAVVLHEMAHSLGFTAGIFAQRGLIVDRASLGGTDPHFIGLKATAAFNRTGGLQYAGTKVPLENCGGCNTGTLDSHWRETVFDTELMTGFLDNNVTNPLSVISTAGMADLGYTVNNAASETYLVANPGASLRTADQAPRLELIDDVLAIPIIVVDRAGRVIRTLPHR